MGRLQLAVRDPARAVQFLQRCVHADPEVPNGWYSLGTAPEAVAVVYQRQLEVVPGHRQAAARLADATIRLGAGR
jgi:predicted Zn-dependent protease